MPFYDYFCEENGKTIEVFHEMSRRIKTWGELCEQAQTPLGKTPKKAKVIRLVSGMPVTWKLKGLDKDDYGTKLRT